MGPIRRWAEGGGQSFDWRIGVWIAVYFGPEIAELIIERFFANLDPPGFATAVASVGPAIAPRLQVVLHVEGTVLRKDPHTRPLACFIEFGKSGGSRSMHLAGQDLQKRETIIDRAMTFMKISCLPDQIRPSGTQLVSGSR
jgi:hypothetical protein